MISLDASGSGGGLVLRGALTLSATTGQAIRLTRIRARRSSPGLRLQHLRLIDLLARACDAFVDGAVPGSQTLYFEPRRQPHWDSVIDVHTPGALTLVLQTLLVPISFSPQTCRPRLVGVTHAARCPAFENLAWHWLPLLERAGYRAEIKLQNAGFAPKGGGIVHATIDPVSVISPLQLTRRGALLRVSGRSVVAGLSPSVAERQRRQVMARLRGLDVPLSLDATVVMAPVPGAYNVLLAEFEHSQQCLCTLGELGKPPEAVANEAAEALLAFLARPGAVDAHTADQLLLPLSCATGDSQISTTQVSEHLLVAAELIDRFLAATVSIDGQPGEPGQILIRGRGVVRSAMPPERPLPFSAPLLPPLPTALHGNPLRV